VIFDWENNYHEDDFFGFDSDDVLRESFNGLGVIPEKRNYYYCQPHF